MSRFNGLISFLTPVMLALVLIWLSVFSQLSFNLAEGADSPHFSVETIGGEALDSKELSGRVLVLNFWYIECPPCRSEIPKLNELVAAYKEEAVEFIAFAPNQESALNEFLSKIPFDYKIIANATPIAVDFGVTGAPTHVIISPRGTIEKVFLGEVYSPIQELGPVIDRLLGN